MYIVPIIFETTEKMHHYHCIFNISKKIGLINYNLFETIKVFIKVIQLFHT